jgi:hypothetical protein
VLLISNGNGIVNNLDVAHVVNIIIGGRNRVVKRKNRRKIRGPIKKVPKKQKIPQSRLEKMHSR